MKRLKKYLAILLSVGMVTTVMPAMAVSGSPNSSEREESTDQGNYLAEDVRDPQEADETKAPEESEEEDETKAPEEDDETKAPEESKGEDETRTPEESEEEDETKAPEESEEADETKAPEESEEADETKAPEESEEEDETKAPEESEEEDETKAPEESEEDETKTPEESKAEDETKTSEKSEKEAEKLAGLQALTQQQTLQEIATKSFVNREDRDSVTFNTGNFEVQVVSEEAFEDGLGDAAFEEDGSYTIQIPEDNPFFPYEVQFTRDEETENLWFMTPDDSVEVGDHTFYVSAYFDGSAVTQMSLAVGGDTVVVYPEEKEFTNGMGISPMSLLPLEEKELTVDLTGYTPVELTMVSVDEIFTGSDALGEDESVMWAYGTSSDFYDISEAGGIIDLSRGTTDVSEDSPYTYWQMIVGDPDQLAAGNTRYIVMAEVTPAKDWLLPVVYQQDADGNRYERTVSMEYGGYQNYANRDRLDIEVEDLDPAMGGVYFSLQVNETLFPDASTDDMEAVEGLVYEPDMLWENGVITSDIFAKDLSAANSGYYSEYLEAEITLVSYDSGQINGLLPIEVAFFDEEGVHINSVGLFTENRTNVVDAWDYPDWALDEVAVLKDGYPTNGTYYLVLECLTPDGQVDNTAVIGAYEGGVYASPEEAEAEGAADIKDQLFDPNGGDPADYSQETCFSIFTGKDGEITDWWVYSLCTMEAIPAIEDGEMMFTGVNDSSGQEEESYVVESQEDSYGEYNYLTIMVGQDADLTRLAPTFYTGEDINLYAEGGNSPEVSGVSVHDFSNGPVQYTASSEDGAARNYWVQIIQAENGAGELYINSLSDEKAETRVENGVVYSTREIVLDWLHDDLHDILLINKGTEPIENLSVELVSDQVGLDEYWTLNGTNELAGFSTIEKTQTYGELPNMAKIRLYDNVGETDEIEGTLTIKSGETILAVLTLTGVVGDPGILTENIPDGVKYVPYGTMIQNSNKYEWNTVEYHIADGELPGGMELRENGELYGVPTESGTFTFTVQMRNSSSNFSTSERTFTMTITENTDANVDGATDVGYELTQRVQDFVLSNAVDQTLVSEGEYSEFRDVFLDGDKLVEGTDYDAESGSTRITIRSQTLRAHDQPGTHTIGIEFRTSDTNTLYRAAQNYVITESGSGSGGGSQTGNGSSQSGGSSGGGGSSSSGSSSSANTITRDPQKGYMSAQMGIITGDREGYSKWIQDETGWKLNYADGTMARGIMAEQADGSTVEQVLWEKVNGAWYAFGADEYLQSGWVYDYQLQKWYLLNVENGMQTGWYQDPQDGFTYYLEPETGDLASGWKWIDQNWYYLNAVVTGRTWELNEETGDWYYNIRSATWPFGALYRSTTTPDGYQVDENGVWIQ